MKQAWMARKPAERGRPAWGFCRVRVETICQLWSAYRCKRLRRHDVQTWFAAHELVMRRCTLRPGRKPSFTVAELQPLTEMTTPALKASVRRLEARGFLSWSTHALTLKDGFDEQCGGTVDRPAMMAGIANQHRTVPIPRHTVLLLAKTRRPVVIATILGHLIRGMYYRSRECVSWGTCKSSWIADTFGVDVRNVKAARGELERVGWLRRIESHHWHRQRNGASFVISLDWTMPSNSIARHISPRRNARTVLKSPPPDSYRNLPSEIKNQKRAKTSGVQGQENKSESKPRLRDVQAVDLKNPMRTAELFRQAVKAGLVTDTTASRLQFFAAAKRAGRLASNPGGFFITIVKQNLWRNIAARDEDLARTELARFPELAFSSREFLHARPKPMLVDNTRMDQTSVRNLVRQSLASVGDSSCFASRILPPPTS